MCELLIFGGTTEGRELAEYCCEIGISAAVSVATDYGGELLPRSEKLHIHVGRLDSFAMEKLINEIHCVAVIDATHPYAQEVTRNIKAACDKLDMLYYRLLRSSADIMECKSVNSMDELVELLSSSNKRILSTLGSKELSKLKNVRNFAERLWIRALPADGVRQFCIDQGFLAERLILEKGPFTVEQNIEHILRCKAEILVTKESGTTGGFPEKIEAAKQCNIEVVVLKRPEESGYSIDDVKKMLKEMR